MSSCPSTNRSPGLPSESRKPVIVPSRVVQSPPYTMGKRPADTSGGDTLCQTGRLGEEGRLVDQARVPAPLAIWRWQLDVARMSHLVGSHCAREAVLPKYPRCEGLISDPPVPVERDSDEFDVDHSLSPLARYSSICLLVTRRL